MATAYFSDSAFLRHDMGDDHPESPGRLRAIEARLKSCGLAGEVDWCQSPEATREQLQRAHPGSYLDQLELMAPRQGRIMADPDTLMTPFTLQAARMAAGAGIEAVNQVLCNQATSAFCAVRPPGHHAEHNKTMGFCFYNNIAVAALHALTFHNLQRVAIVDFDVHQGNGTVDIFRNDPRVMICSSFQHPFYPHSPIHGLREGIINTPLEAYSRGRDFRRQVENAWLHRLQDFKPQLILISAGFDADKRDPMAQLELDARDFRWITEMITDVARMHCRGRVVSMLEGGYHLGALADGVEAHLGELVQISQPAARGFTF
ncbi:MAG: histone deacetylase family protein [Halomonadaceae bacterium]|nr:MAG: histone deacetylase family protein [Halomonadaceae bacterium]